MKIRRSSRSAALDHEGPVELSMIQPAQREPGGECALRLVVGTTVIEVAMAPDEVARLHAILGTLVETEARRAAFAEGDLHKTRMVRLLETALAEAREAANDLPDGEPK